MLHHFHQRSRGTVIYHFLVWSQAHLLDEGENPQGFVEQIAASQVPFAKWFRDKVLEIHGVDLTKPVGLPLEAVGDVRTDSIPIMGAP
ncbi:MAG: hypothetical protein QG577_785 [Thermodesulfobacteriota bacterium]|nr:hypothetical protein [Thermodesulfobacteriota bacterium]